MIGVSPGYAGPSDLRPFCRTAEILYIDQNYPRRVEEAGGIPVLLSHTDDPEAMRQLAQRLDGLLFTGGEDVNPSLYGQDVHDATEVAEARDKFEFHLFRLFVETGKPILAICRGFQVINVALGGTLIQDIPTQAGVAHHAQRVPSSNPTHEVRLEESCRLSRVFGETLLRVNSHHHQGVDKPAPPLRVVGRSEEGVAEAMEHRGHPYLVAVQWHPERLASCYALQQKLFVDFVAACRLPAYRQNGVTAQ
jgi:putative glutamine amidotransferase